MNLPTVVAHAGWDEALLVGVAILIYFGLRWRDKRAEEAGQRGEVGQRGEAGEAGEVGEVGEADEPGTSG
jgi:hypothetical protein